MDVLRRLYGEVWRSSRGSLASGLMYIMGDPAEGVSLGHKCAVVVGGGSETRVTSNRMAVKIILTAVLVALSVVFVAGSGSIHTHATGSASRQD